VNSNIARSCSKKRGFPAKRRLRRNPLRRTRGKTPRRPGRREAKPKRQKRRRAQMDTSSYFQGTFLKVEDLAGEAMEATIEKVEEGRYGLVLILDNGSQLSLNTTMAE
jgi:hypothetical protein